MPPTGTRLWKSPAATTAVIGGGIRWRCIPREPQWPAKKLTAFVFTRLRFRAQYRQRNRRHYSRSLRMKYRTKFHFDNTTGAPPIGEAPFARMWRGNDGP